MCSSDLSNPNPAKGYPIVTFSWILLYKAGNGAGRHDALQKAFSYTLSESAQAKAADLGFISLPVDVVSKAKAALASVQP